MYGMQARLVQSLVELSCAYGTGDVDVSAAAAGAAGACRNSCPDNNKLVEQADANSTAHYICEAQE